MVFSNYTLDVSKLKIITLFWEGPGWEWYSWRGIC